MENEAISTIEHRIVKASFKDNPPEERKLFPQSSCLMPISVGQSIHEGVKLEAVIKLVNASFKQCTILIDDSIQRHTIGIIEDATPEALHQMAIAAGDAWLERNEKTYQQLTISYNIMRWDDWCYSSSYSESLHCIHNEYNLNEHFREAIHDNIDDFLTRYLNRFDASSVDYKRAFKLCLDYLIEECAVMCLWAEKAYDFEVYPSGRNKAMSATYHYLIKPRYPERLRPVAIRFKKYRATISAQSFPAQDVVLVGV